MANIGGEDGGPRRRRWWMAAWLGAGALLSLPFYVMQITDDRDDVVLTRNEVVREPSGDEVWHGAFTNRTDRRYREVAVEILFVDGTGESVGKVARRVDQLDPGQKLTLQAPLASRAVGLKVHSVRWLAGDGRADLGPYQPWPFGRVQD